MLLGSFNDQTDTWEPRGNERVQIRTPFPALEKRQSTVQPSIEPDNKKMQYFVIFHGTGKRTSVVERAVYGPRVVVHLLGLAKKDIPREPQGRRRQGAVERGASPPLTIYTHRRRPTSTSIFKRNATCCFDFSRKATPTRFSRSMQNMDGK